VERNRGKRNRREKWNYYGKEKEVGIDG